MVMENLPSQKKRWVLTQQAFEQLLARLDADRERTPTRRFASS
jgi:hypothetical protein